MSLLPDFFQRTFITNSQQETKDGDLIINVDASLFDTCMIVMLSKTNPGVEFGIPKGTVLAKGINKTKRKNKKNKTKRKNKT